MLRTSVSNPLRIDGVQAGAAPGWIGMTFCPGKCQAVSMSGGWKRDLAIDLDAIRSWGSRVLLSFMEEHELEAVGVPPADLARLAADRGIEWIHLPIVDGSVPSERFLERWRVLAPRLDAFLERGDRIVLHCLGGLGRTGMMAACLLIEAGLSATEAMVAVRAARGGTIETREQEEFVLRYTPVSR
jgi:rhodanese-related sulfurtransferase